MTEALAFAQLQVAEEMIHIVESYNKPVVCLL